MDKDWDGLRLRVLSMGEDVRLCYPYTDLLCLSLLFPRDPNTGLWVDSFSTVYVSVFYHVPVRIHETLYRLPTSRYVGGSGTIHEDTRSVYVTRPLWYGLYQE